MLRQRLIVKWPLTLIGDGPLKKEVLRKIEELGLSSDTKVTGFITDKERNTRISEAKWMVTSATNQ